MYVNLYWLKIFLGFEWSDFRWVPTKWEMEWNRQTEMKCIEYCGGVWKCIDWLWLGFDLEINFVYRK